VASRPPDPSEASIEIRPSIPYTGKMPETPETPDASEAQAVVLVSCGDFADPGSRTGPWMMPEEERGFLEEARRHGRLAVRLGPDIEEPWRIA
jgi:hypothetical protein